MSAIRDAAKAMSALGASKGGKARAAKLLAKERSSIAKQAADARWGIPKADFEGELILGDLVIPCAVLDDGTRLLSERGFSKAIGIKRSGSHWQRRKADEFGGAQLPVFISANNLKPFIGNELAAALSNPIKYRTKHGSVANGVNANLIPQICDAWLELRNSGHILGRQAHIAAKAEILVRGLAHIGIVALVDEATGYQTVRDRKELHKILEAYIAKELLPWAKRFPDEFYQQMFRLRGWSFNPATGKKPILAGKLTEKVVYKKLPEGVLEALKKKNPKDEKGRRRHKYFQFLTEDVGDPHLEKHLLISTALMRASRTWPEFLRLLDRAVPPPGGNQTEMEFMDSEDNDSN